MLASTPALTGIHVSGGGQDGVIGALRDEGEGRNIIAVCNELTAHLVGADRRDRRSGAGHADCTDCVSVRCADGPW